MLELRGYERQELFAVLGSENRESAERKLKRWGVEFVPTGRGNNLKYTITAISNPFKVFCITELGFDAGTDFQKVRNFYYYFFNDEEFMTMPDEVKEYRMREKGKPIARQTIANYEAKLNALDVIRWQTKEFIYYFAFKQTQRITDKTEYLQAWHDYWEDKNAGLSSLEAIWNMREKYGGVARKQAIPEVNAIYDEKIEYMLSLIQESFEDEMGE